MANNEFRLGNGTIRRSKHERGAPYWGRLRMSPAQLAALIAWSDQNTPTGNGDGGDVFWELEIGAWVKDGQEGDKFFSFVLDQPYKSQRVSVGSVGPTRTQPAPAPAPAATPAPSLDSLPF